MLFSRKVLLLLVLLGFCSRGSAQVTADLIAARIASDCGGDRADYWEYSVKLATLLSTYDSAALQRILGVNSAAAPVELLNDTLSLEPINFAYRSPTLMPASHIELDKVADYLRANPDAKIQIAGHVSEDYAGAMSLSEARAQSAKLYLAQSGIDPSRVETVGYGFSQPIDGATGEENRRIEITVVE